MKLIIAVILLLVSALAIAGCRLYLWAGDHELSIPTAAPTATPEPSPTASSSY